jgi:dienelactone hydrolase
MSGSALIGAIATVCLSLASAASAQELARGDIIDRVGTADDPAETYALYLPSTYTPDRQWNVLLGFHPGARGRAIVEKYRAAAETYGYIVAASNTSRNGPWEVSARAATAMSGDVFRRFAVNPDRIYLTGFSGGARVAMQIAMAGNRIAGVIASGAGYPDARPRRSVPFLVFGTVGLDDFNYIELRRLDRELATPHRVVFFEGGHTLPPDDVAREAIEWLELRAMAAGTRPREAALVDRLWQQRLRAVDAAGESAAAVHLLRAMEAEFAGLRDALDIGHRAAMLEATPAIKRALDQQRDDDEAEARLIDRFIELEAGLRSEERRSDSLMTLRVLLADLSKKAAAGADTGDRRRARRVLRVVASGASQRVQDRDYLALIEKYRLPRP